MHWYIKNKLDSFIKVVIPQFQLSWGSLETGEGGYLELFAFCPPLWEGVGLVDVGYLPWWLWWMLSKINLLIFIFKCEIFLPWSQKYNLYLPHSLSSHPTSFSGSLQESLRREILGTSCSHPTPIQRKTFGKTFVPLFFLFSFRLFFFLSFYFLFFFLIFFGFSFILIFQYFGLKVKDNVIFDPL